MLRPIAASVLISLLTFSESLYAQQPTQALQSDSDKPRVYVTDSDSWQMQGAAGGNSSGFGATSSGGARPQTAEIIKTFGERCPNVVVNSRVDLSQYVVRLEHEGGKGYLRKDNKVAVFVRETGDTIFSKSTMSLGGSVQDACGAIAGHWATHAEELKSKPIQAAATSTTGPATVVEKAKLKVTSTPSGADIEINGNFVGNTPSDIEVDPGKNEVKISKKGFSTWSRIVMVKGGSITLNAELDAAH